MQFPSTHTVIGSNSRGSGESTRQCSIPQNIVTQLNKTCFYARLGLTNSAGAVDVKKAYRELSKIVHPDKGGDKDLFLLLKQAYESLIDPESSRIYDNGSCADSCSPPYSYVESCGDKSSRAQFLEDSFLVSDLLKRQEIRENSWDDLPKSDIQVQEKPGLDVYINRVLAIYGFSGCSDIRTSKLSVSVFVTAKCGSKRVQALLPVNYGCQPELKVCNYSKSLMKWARNKKSMKPVSSTGTAGLFLGALQLYLQS